MSVCELTYVSHLQKNYMGAGNPRPSEFGMLEGYLNLVILQFFSVS
jgi:hypothetical protein